MAELIRRDLFKAAGATAAALGVASLRRPASALFSTPAQAQTIAWNHDPASPIGPPHWGTIGFPVCGTCDPYSPTEQDAYLKKMPARPGLASGIVRCYYPGHGSRVTCDNRTSGLDRTGATGRRLRQYRQPERVPLPRGLVQADHRSR